MTRRMRQRFSSLERFAPCHPRGIPAKAFDIAYTTIKNEIEGYEIQVNRQDRGFIRGRVARTGEVCREG